MSEIRLFYRENNRLKISKNIDLLKEIPLENFVWIDLNDVPEDAEIELEQFLKIYIQEEEEMEEIEISSRYMETEDTLVANSRFLLNNFEEEPISFIVKNHILVSVRSQELRSFNETVKKMFANPRNYPNGFYILVALLETRVEYDADMIEDLAREITQLSNRLKTDDDVSDDILIAIKELQEKTMLIRENIIDKQRVCSNMLKSELFPNEAKTKLAIIIKDINSLFEHTRFSFDRLEYLQDTFLGLVNIQQNKIIKIFTIVSVIFLPPTLIASMYGMNFDFMPELHWKYGYLWAISLMILFVVAILWFFRYRKWL
ncbi:MAG TPA: magnesium/cobalt transporter CorA [Salinivirgaceae bacterium]|nr:magnesium/cobalt transporter CorA [Salinivirgaceae bacterium]HQB68999.1 magnesium/cobalt transporter CorA [Paludibacteraceae bacterium]HRS67178.1 magnesium/cobalt transporter CorA [Paludibacteraceae bacterium]